MNTVWIVFASILILNALLSLGISLSLSRKDTSASGAKEMSRMLLGLTTWAFFYGLTAITANYDLKFLWLIFENLGIASVPIFWFLFAARYTKQDKWLTRPLAAALWIIPVITWIFLFTHGWFHLYYTGAVPYDGEYGPFIVYKAPWYWVQLTQNYGLLAAGTGLLIWRMLLFSSIYRRQLLAVLGALAIPWLVNILYQIGPDWLPKLDLTSISFTLSASLISVSVYGMQLFNLIPIARYIVMEHIPEMVLVTDVNHRILDVNMVAQTWLGMSSKEIIGCDLPKVLHQWPQLVDSYMQFDEVTREIEVPGEGGARALEIVITPIHNRLGSLDGRVIVAHDMTQHRRMEVALKDANDSLTKQLAQIESLQMQLMEQAIRDPLTALYNRRYMAEALEREISQAERTKKPVSIIIIDIDHFKKFNDTYGHKCGDIVLLSLGEMLQKDSRRGDMVCRYGGEEFVILLPGASIETGFARAEAWRQKFANSIVKYKGKKLSATFSAGVATYPLHSEDGESVLQMADRALYASKAKGRNCVTVFSSTADAVVSDIS